MKEIFWIEGEPKASLAIVLRPRGGDWLEDELLRMKQGGIQILASMLEEEEAESLVLSDERKIATNVGLEFLSYPVPDRTTPTEISTFSRFVSEIADHLRAGRRVGVHCRGSIGRASIAAACALVQLGWQPAEALAAIEAARGCAVPDTEEQRAWILRYEAVP